MNSRRVRVVGPEETPVDTSFYEGATGHEPSNFTAFRKAERLYKRKPVDLSKVIDFSNGYDPEQDPRIKPAGTFEMVDQLSGERVVKQMYTIEGYEGFIYIPQCLNMVAQRELCNRCFRDYMNPPNLSNLNAHYEFHDFTGFHDAYEREKLDFIQKSSDSAMNRLTTQTEVEAMVRKIRWVTLGYQYDWTTKTYDFDREPNPFPEDLKQYGQEIASGAGFDLMPEAGIVNYYQEGDQLTGHVDRSEKNMSVPLLSISLGSSAIFLLGGPDRDDPVVALMVRSGDVSFLSGPARKYYHGVPKILPDLGDNLLNHPLIKNARLNINIRQVL